jgi:hypothetical protein
MAQQAQVDAMKEAQQSQSGVKLLEFICNQAWDGKARADLMTDMGAGLGSPFERMRDAKSMEVWEALCSASEQVLRQEPDARVRTAFVGLVNSIGATDMEKRKAKCTDTLRKQLAHAHKKDKDAGVRGAAHAAVRFMGGAKRGGCLVM